MKGNDLFSYLNSKDIKSWKVKPKRKKLLLTIRDMNQEIIKGNRLMKKSNNYKR